VPKNIELIYLPPYSPELNPVERLWQWLKRHTLRNRYCRTLKDIEDAVQKCLEKAAAPFFEKPVPL
jgi:transposase